MAKGARFREWQIDSGSYWGLLAVLAVLVVLGGLAALYMEHQGHWVTGMNNRVVWGTPHVFAVFLIVAASGALNVAALSTVFAQTVYKPLARLSGLLALALLVGGLLILVLDLGRPERLVVAMTTYNFRSIFAWNIFLYTGFIAIVVAYLFTTMERKAAGYNRSLAFLSFFWRLALTTGTGSIFGFLVARQGFDAAIMAPLFIVMSFAYGMALYLLVLIAACRADDRPLGTLLLLRLRKLLAIFVASVLYMTLVYHLTNLYGAENLEFEEFILRSGGIYTFLFWAGWVFAGGLLPLGLLAHPVHGRSPGGIATASLLVVLGGFATLYVIIIGGQAHPMSMFPGKMLVESGFGDVVASYAPSLPELLLGIGGFGIAILATVVGMRVLKFLPESLADEVVAPPRA